MELKRLLLATVTVCLITIGAVVQVEAAHGCPLDNAQCQDYCSQQGCSLGYCGHFAWIQCICRKCGDEWGYYDKVHYNPDKQVNQTELDSLKLNRSEPLILTNNEQQQQQQQQRQKHATLTTLLIPDLSDNSKLDLNDIPDENSEKFLDFLAKNHEKLVEATSQNSRNGQQLAPLDLSDDTADQVSSPASRQAFTTTTLATPTDETPEATVEIQISSSNNNSNSNNNGGGLSKRDSDQEGDAGQTDDLEQAGARLGSVTRLLKMAVAERSSEEIERRRRRR